MPTVEYDARVTEIRKGNRHYRLGTALTVGLVLVDPTAVTPRWESHEVSAEASIFNARR